MPLEPIEEESLAFSDPATNAVTILMRDMLLSGKFELPLSRPHSRSFPEALTRCRSSRKFVWP